MTREERFKMDMIDEFKQMCEIVEKDGRIIENKRRMLKALSQEPICPSHGIDCEDCPAYDPCGDVISRQGVLDLAKKGILVSNGNYKSVCKVINELPSVNPQTKTGHWIPVSERLPVEGGEYLITWTGVMDGFEKRSKPIISVTEYEIYEPDNYADWITNVSNDFEHYHDIKVTAWMPLPKPFDPQESEEQG